MAVHVNKIITRNLETCRENFREKMTQKYTPLVAKGETIKRKAVETEDDKPLQ